MIHNDQELKATQERIAHFEEILMQLRVTATPEEFPLVSSGYRNELLRMQQQVYAYLTRHASEPVTEELSV
jgi:hypothetical protein